MAAKKRTPLAERPGANLARLLEQLGRDRFEFAFAVGMSSASERAAERNLRRYLPELAGAELKRPSVDMVQRWADELGIDGAELYAEPGEKS